MFKLEAVREAWTKLDAIGSFNKPHYLFSSSTTLINTCNWIFGLAAGIPSHVSEHVVLSLKSLRVITTYNEVQKIADLPQLPPIVRKCILLAAPFLFFVPRGYASCRWYVKPFSRLRDNYAGLIATAEAVMAIGLIRCGRYDLAMGMGASLTERYVGDCASLPIEMRNAIKIGLSCAYHISPLFVSCFASKMAKTALIMGLVLTWFFLPKIISSLSKTFTDLLEEKKCGILISSVKGDYPLVSANIQSSFVSLIPEKQEKDEGEFLLAIKSLYLSALSTYSTDSLPQSIPELSDLYCRIYLPTRYPNDLDSQMNAAMILASRCDQLADVKWCRGAKSGWSKFLADLRYGSSLEIATKQLRISSLHKIYRAYSSLPSDFRKKFEDKHSFNCAGEYENSARAVRKALEASGFLTPVGIIDLWLWGHTGDAAQALHYFINECANDGKRNALQAQSVVSKS